MVDKKREKLDPKSMCPENFKKLVKRVNALENITLTKLFKKTEPHPDSFTIQYGGILIAFNPNNDEETQFVKRFLDLISNEEMEK